MVDLLSTTIAALPGKVVSSLLTAIAIGLLAFFSRSVQRVFLYKRHSFELPNLAGGSASEWDIQWEDLRVTLAVKQVHNTHVEELIVKTQDVSPGQKLGDVNPGESYHELAGPPKWYLKLASIVRTKAGGSRAYSVNICILRPRWRWL